MSPLSLEAAKLLAEPWKERAFRRWPGLGAWVDYDFVSGVWSCGIHRTSAHGAERVQLGRGLTPEAAFAAADKREERLRDAESKPHVKGPPKVPREGWPYRIAGDLFDD